MFLWEEFWWVEVRKWPISFHSSPDINFISPKVQAQSFIKVSLDRSLASEGYWRLNRHWFCSLLWVLRSSKLTLQINCWCFWLHSTFQFIVLQKHWLKFLFQAFKPQFFLFGLFGSNLIEFDACIGNVNVRERQKSVRRDKPSNWNSKISLTTGLIYSTKVVISKFILYEEFWT